MQRKLQALLGSTDIHTLASVLKIVSFPPPPSSLNFHLHSALQYCCSTARRKAENFVVQSTERQQCVSAKLGLAARGRTARMLLTHSLPWGPVAHVTTKFNSHRIFFFCFLSSRMLFLVEVLL